MDELSNFKYRLKSIGSVIQHAENCKKIFIENGFDWDKKWDKIIYGDTPLGFYTLVPNFDPWQDDSSVFGEEVEGRFIKWLYYGNRKDLKCFYEFFASEMNDLLLEKNKEVKEAKVKKVKEKEFGWIYLIKSKQLYKIGRSKNISSRINAYRTENPHGIEVVASVQVDDYVKTEDDLLKQYQVKQYRGEWFNLTEQDAQDIKKYLESL